MGRFCKGQYSPENSSAVQRIDGKEIEKTLYKTKECCHGGDRCKKQEHQTGKRPSGGAEDFLTR